MLALCSTMPYIRKVEGRALSRLPPTVQPTSVARKPKGCAEPDLRRQPPAHVTQADIHASLVAGITRGFGRNLTIKGASPGEIFTERPFTFF